MKHVNIVSPTGCVHRAENSRFSTKGSRSTLCNHRNYFRSWGSHYHDWPDTDKPVTCKRCLALMTPKPTARRYDFKWIKVANEVHATVTIAEWFNHQGSVLGLPENEEKFLLYATKHSVGMRGLNGSTIPKMSETRCKWLYAVAQAYYAATFDDRETYIWSLLD